MNRQEWTNLKRKPWKWKHLVTEKLNEWKQSNGLTGTYDVHHRDDVPEATAYNEAHYEYWGFNLDGTFEYGKYVIFLPHAEHSSHTNKGKAKSLEHRKRLSDSRIGFKMSEETKRKMSEAQLGENNAFYGKHHTDETKQKISASKIGIKMSDEARQNISKGHIGIPLSTEHKQKINEANQRHLIAYRRYHDEGGTLRWNQFRHAVATGELNT